MQGDPAPSCRSTPGHLRACSHVVGAFAFLLTLQEETSQSFLVHIPIVTLFSRLPPLAASPALGQGCPARKSGRALGAPRRGLKPFPKALPPPGPRRAGFLLATWPNIHFLSSAPTCEPIDQQHQEIRFGGPHFRGEEAGA